MRPGESGLDDPGGPAGPCGLGPPPPALPLEGTGLDRVRVRAWATAVKKYTHYDMCMVSKGQY